MAGRGSFPQRRAAAGREDAARLPERLGWAGAERPGGRLIWLHGVSIGEGLSMLPLMAALRAQAPDVRFLLTTGTVASARALLGRLPEGCLHQYAPVDCAAAVARFLGHWRPDLAIWVESELWPRLMVDTARGGTPMMLVNARISTLSARRWRRVPGMAAALLALFRRIVAQDAESAARLMALGTDAGRVHVGGNLKALVPAPGCDDAELARLRAALAGRPVWLAASTHGPEEVAVAAAHRAAGLPGLLTIVAPRHPERGDEIAALFAAEGLAVARRSRGQSPEPTTAVWLADTLGEIGLWLRLAHVCFLGGSLAPRGGHNPFEPLALGAAILHGPAVADFASAYAALDAAGGARLVADTAALGAAVAELLDDEAARRTMTDAAGAVLSRMQPDVTALAAEALVLMKPGQ